ncbi:hypothetical protein [Bdellovibrio sp. BCCA]|uniref:hypothetical protein n=1 Tax=Bdellovibrio sp. BCCA TaxID=3136281 RepID=UPI0030F2B5FF
MDKANFDGTLVLEKLAEIDKLDEFNDAIDADDFVKVKSLMREAHIDFETIANVMKKMADADGKH